MASIVVPRDLVGDSAPESQSLVNDRDLEVNLSFHNELLFKSLTARFFNLFCKWER